MDDPAAVFEEFAVPEFNLLGPVTVVVDDAPVALGGPRQIAVLARLLLNAGRVVSMDQLVDSIWDGDDPARPDVAIRSYVSNLRRAIEPGRDRGDPRSCVESSPPGYRLVVPLERIDSHRFEGLVRAGRERLVAGDPAAAVDHLSGAGTLWRGVPCEGLIDTEAFVAFRARMSERHLTMTELAFEARLGLGEHEALLPDLESAIAANPLRERLTALGMLALYQAGRQSDALAVCRALRERLVEQLGIDPGRLVQALEHKILTQDPSLAPLGLVRDRLGEVSGNEMTNLAVGQQTVGSRRRAEPDHGLDRGETGIEERLADESTELLVGRHRELRSLAVVGAALRQGRGATVLITGEPGSGKTALVGGLCDTLSQADIVISWGRCRAVGRGRMLWPWGQLLDGLAPHLGRGTMSGLDCLAALAPSLGRGRRRPPVEVELPTDPGEASAWFQPIVELLRRVADKQPVALVIDDAHWADEATVELLLHVATVLADRPVAVIVTWRDTDSNRPETQLRALARLPTTTRVELGGLDHEAVEQLVEDAGVGGGRSASRLLSETAGNPLLIRELIAGLSEGDSYEPGDAAPPVTATLRDVVLDRTEVGDEATSEVLRAAALHERRFSAEVLAEATEHSPTVVDHTLAAASAAGLITPDGDRSYRFVHPILATVLAEQVPAAARERLHIALGNAMWRNSRPASDLAFHFARAATPRATILAARFALESASGSFDLATLPRIEAIVSSGLLTLDGMEDSTSLVGELSGFLGQAARLRGRRSEWRARALRAVEVSVDQNDDDDDADDVAPMVAAALGATGATVDGPVFGAASFIVLEPDTDEAVALLSTTLDRVGAAARLAPILRIRRAGLLARSADGGAMHARAMADEVAAVTSTSGVDNDVRLAALVEYGRFLIDVGEPEEQLDVARRIEQGADASAAHQHATAARLRLVAHMGGGEPAPDPVLRPTSVPVSPDEPDGDADQSLASWLDQTSVLVTADLVMGRTAIAEHRLHLARTRCEELKISAGSFDRQLMVLRWDQGKGDEVHELVLASRSTGALGDQVGFMALALVEGGRIVEAEHLLDELADRPNGAAADMPFDQLALVAYASYRLRHKAMAKITLRALSPRRRSAVVATRGVVILGGACLFAGQAAVAAGRLKQARELLAESETAARATMSKPWLARTLVAKADLAEAGKDRDRAASSLTEVNELVAGTGLGVPGRLGAG